MYEYVLNGWIWCKQLLQFLARLFEEKWELLYSLWCRRCRWLWKSHYEFLMTSCIMVYLHCFKYNHHQTSQTLQDHLGYITYESWIKALVWSMFSPFGLQKIMLKLFGHFEVVYLLLCYISITFSPINNKLHTAFLHYLGYIRNHNHNSSINFEKKGLFNRKLRSKLCGKFVYCANSPFPLIQSPPNFTHHFYTI